MVTALRFCAEHVLCAGCPEEGHCTVEFIQGQAADMIERLAAELEEEKRKNGERG